MREALTQDVLDKILELRRSGDVRIMRSKVLFEIPCELEEVQAVQMSIFDLEGTT